MPKRRLCRAYIRRERLAKASTPAILLTGYILSLGLYTAGLGIPYLPLLWLQWGIFLAVSLCLSIWCIRMANPRRTSFAKSILRFSGPRELDELMQEIEEDLEDPVYRGTGIRIRRRWAIAGFYFPKVVRLEHTAGVFLIESKDQAHNFYLRFLDDNREPVTFLIGFESTARKAYDYLLTLCTGGNADCGGACEPLLSGLEQLCLRLCIWSQAVEVPKFGSRGRPLSHTRGP